MIVILILLSSLLYLFINYFIIRRNGRNVRDKIIQFIQYLKDLKDKLLNKNKYEKLGYKKFDD